MEKTKITQNAQYLIHEMNDIWSVRKIASVAGLHPHTVRLIYNGTTLNITEETFDMIKSARTVYQEKVIGGHMLLFNVEPKAREFVTDLIHRSNTSKSNVIQVIASQGHKILIHCENRQSFGLYLNDRFDQISPKPRYIWVEQEQVELFKKQLGVG